jgi:hypothetical protein
LTSPFGRLQSEEVRFPRRPKAESADQPGFTGLASPAYTLSAQNKRQPELITVSLAKNRLSQSLLVLGCFTNWDF